MKYSFPLFIFYFLILNPIYSQQEKDGSRVKVENGKNITIFDSPSGKIDVNNYSNDFYQVRGRITNGGKSIPNLQIEVFSESNSIDTTFTDSLGFFLFENLFVGFYKLRVVSYPEVNSIFLPSFSTVRQLRIPFEIKGDEKVKNFPIDLTRLISFKYIHNSGSNTVAFLDGHRLYASFNKENNCMGEHGQSFIFREKGQREVLVHILKGKHKFSINEIIPDSSSDCTNFHIGDLIYSLNEEILFNKVCYNKSSSFVSVEPVMENKTHRFRLKIETLNNGFRNNEIQVKAIVLNDENSEIETFKKSFTPTDFLCNSNPVILIPFEIFEPKRIYTIQLLLLTKEGRVLDRILDLKGFLNNIDNQVTGTMFFFNELDLAKSYIQIHEFEKANSLFNQILIDSTTEYKIVHWNSFGNYYSQIGNLKAEIFCYKKLLAIDSLNLGAKNNLAVAYFRNGNFDIALEKQKECIKLFETYSPSNKENLLILYTSLFYFSTLNGDYSTAKKILSIDQLGKSNDLHFEKGKFIYYACLGDKKAAKKVFKENENKIYHSFSFLELLSLEIKHLQKYGFENDDLYKISSRVLK